MRARPPALARLLLRLLPPPHRDFVSGDLEEEYTDTVLPTRGALRARLWFWAQAIRSVGAFLRWRAEADHRLHTPPVVREARHAWRGLRRRPGFALMAVLTLAVGIGATSSVFGVADAVLFRPVSGVARQGELVTFRFRGDRDVMGFSLSTLRSLAAAAPGAAVMAGYQPMLLQVAGSGLPARTAWAHLVTGRYFDLLGVEAARGRLFTTEEADAADGPALAVVSDAFWRNALGADPGVLGRALRFNGTPFTVVGVAPPAFRGVERLDSLQVWLPGSAYVALRHGEAVPTWQLRNRLARFFYHGLARLAPGATPADLQRQLRAAMARQIAAYPGEDGDYEQYRATVQADFGLDEGDRESLASTLKILTALTLVILLVTCANVANLLVLHGLRRQGETALRRALGAARSHLLLSHVVEALLLALPAVVVGLFVALLINAAAWRTGLFPPGVARHVTVDGRVFLFAATTGAFTAVVFGLLPSILAARVDPHTVLKSAQRTTSRAANLLQAGLSVTQLSLSLALVGGALLLGRSLANLARVDVGFSPDQVLAFEFDPGPQGYDREATSAFQRDVLDGASRISGVQALAVSGFPPFGRIAMALTLQQPVDPSRTQFVMADWVSEGFFDVLGVPLIAGRGITRAEATPAAGGADKATILSRTLAARLFGTPERALGRILQAEAFGDRYALRVVGVAADIVDGDLRREPMPKLYTSLPGSPQSWTTLLIRTHRAPDRVAADVRRVLSGVDPNVPIVTAQSMADQVARATSRERTFVQLAALLAVIAILLAAVGLYSVVAYAAAERRREFGIRMAVGASSVRITRLVLRQALVLGVPGVVFGVVLSGTGARLLGSVLYDVAPTDPAVLGAAAVVLLLVSVAASLSPALSATRVDPADTLRSE